MQSLISCPHYSSLGQFPTHLSTWEFCLFSDYQQVALTVNQDVLDVLAPWNI